MARKHPKADPPAALTLDAALHSGPPVPEAARDLADAAITAMVGDLAQDIYPAQEIAKRYGFRDVGHMLSWLDGHAAVKAAVKRGRALFQSDANLRERNREYAGHALLHAMPTLAAVLTDESVDIQTRIELTKVMTKLAGLDGTAAQRDAGSGLQPFAINFVFPQGHEKFTTVVEGKVDAGEPAA